MSIPWNRTPSDYKVRLSDGETYCFYPSLRFKVITVESIQDEDWKTAIAQDKEEIPANTELEVLDVLTNFYGRWLKVIYNDSLYYIDPSKVKYINSIERCL